MLNRSEVLSELDAFEKEAVFAARAEDAVRLAPQGMVGKHSMRP